MAAVALLSALVILSVSQGIKPRIALADDLGFHIVSPGETLLSIAQHYGISIQSLMELNGLENPDLLQPGQRLLITAGKVSKNAASSSIYRVQPGDTAWSIATRHGVTLDGLIEANGLSDASLIRIGQELIIPVSGSPRSAHDPRETGGEVIHRVESGETIYGIALRYNVDVQSIVAANGLSNPDLIRVGYELVIPGTGAYTVERTGHPQPSARGGAREQTPTPPASPANKEGEMFQITYYCLSGRMASGRQVYSGAAAADASILPLGARVLVDELGEFVVEDRFARDLGQKRLDIWVPDCQQAQRRGIEYRKVIVID